MARRAKCEGKISSKKLYTLTAKAEEPKNIMQEDAAINIVFRNVFIVKAQIG